VKEVVDFVKRERGAVLTVEERLDILLLQVKLRQEKAERQKKDSSGRKPTSYDVSKRVAWLLNRKETLVREVWKTYVQQRQMTVAKPPGNASARPTRAPRTKTVTTHSAICQEAENYRYPYCGQGRDGSSGRTWIHGG